MDQLQTQLLGLLQIIIGGVISVAGAYATIYIKKAIAIAKAKAENMQDEQTKSLVTNTLDKVDDLIETNIIAVENTMKPAMLQAIADGKVDKSELKSLAIIVKENVLNQLSRDATEVFNSSLNDPNGYLTSRIEKILAELKSADGTVVNKTIISDTQSPIVLKAPNVEATVVDNTEVSNTTSIEESRETVTK